MSTKKRSKVRLYIQWALLNGGMAWLAWAGVNGNEGAGRLIAFAAWVLGLFQLVGAASADIKAKAVKRGRLIPVWLYHGFGNAMICFLVWHGWWLTAIAFLVDEIAELAIFHKDESATGEEEL